MGARHVAFLTLLCAASHAVPLQRPPTRSGVAMKPSLPQRQVMQSTVWRLRGGASSSKVPAPSKKPKPAEPAVNTKAVMRILASAILPTLLRLLYAVVTTSPAPAVEAAPTLLQRLGVTVAPAAVPSSPKLPWPEAWQVGLATAWVANNLAVMVPGRYDGRSAMAAEKPTAETANLFTPSGWAFIIWAPIFLGEWLMMLYLTSGLPGTMAIGAATAPGWIAATAAQVAWCAAFRPSVCGPSMLWLPAVLLAITGGWLGVSHRAIRSQAYGTVANALVRWPVTLHFGWISAASLVNLNNWLARRGTSLGLKEAVAKGSVAAAVVAAAYVTASTRDPVYPLVIAWALAAVAADGSRSARGLVDDATLDRVRTTARLGCGLAVLLVCTQL